MFQQVEVSEAKVGFVVDGSGPGLVLLHGAGGNAETNWSSVLGALSAKHKIVRPDFSGSGRTVDDGGPLTIPMLAAQVVAAAEQARATPFDLVGFSLGAIVATYMAAEYPHLVRSVVLLAGSPVSGDIRQTSQFELWRELIRTDRKAMARLLLLTGFSPNFLGSMDHGTVDHIVEGLVANNNWDGLARQTELLMTHDIRDQARRIAQPALVIGCTHDYMMPPAHSRSLAGLIPDARYLEIATGHLAAAEKPDEVAQLILGFLSDNVRPLRRMGSAQQ
jgi:3-oxoadipate enol-lactonase